MYVFPAEIIEQILLKCDGKTLLSARKIDAEWKDHVDYITRKTNIWKWCCLEEIPEKELPDYLKSYNNDDNDKWLSIYVNWCSWQDIKSLKCDILRTPITMNKISCIATCGKYIAIGSADGKIEIYNSNWKMIHTARHFAVKISKASFLISDKDENQICIVLAHNKSLLIYDFNSDAGQEILIHDVKFHSVFQNYLCYEKSGGRMFILKLLENSDLSEIWFTRIYSPTCTSCINMWNGVCSVLINNQIKYVKYNETLPVSTFKKKTKIKFNFISNDSFYYVHSQLILRDDVVISIYRYRSPEEDSSDFIEFIFLDENDGYSKKLFNTWEIFNCTITCIFLYGNTLILGVDIGNIYMYHVSSWKNLDLREYGQKIIIGKHPIISIDAVENKDSRKFFVSSRFCVHQVSAYSLNYLI